MPAYAELQITSNFGFLRGASHPEELVVQAQSLGLAAIALADRNSFAGIVRAHQQAKESGLRFLVGCRLDLVGGTPLLCWPTPGPAPVAAPRWCAGPPTGRATAGSSRLLPPANGPRPKAAAPLTRANVLPM